VEKGRRQSMDEVCVSNVWKSYGAAPVLRDVSLSVRAGEVHGLCGQNGAGKTTLIKIMTGVERADLGHLEVSGVKVELRSAAHARHLGISVVHQEPSLADQVSVAENLFAGSLPMYRGLLVDWSATWRQAHSMLAEIGIEDVDVRAPVGELSIAERSLVALARAVSVGRKLIILDEPTSSLDPSESARVLEVLTLLASQGKGVLYVSHRLSEIVKVCDRVTVLRDGIVAGTHDSREVTRASLVAEMIGAPAARVRTTEQFVDAAATGGQEAVLDVVGLAGPGFDGVSLQVFPGEIVGLAGLVGAGRSEFAQTVVGLRRRFAGKVFVDGKEVSFTCPSRAIERGIVYVPEDRERSGIFPDLSVAANITISQLSRISRRFFLLLGRERELGEQVASDVQLRPPAVGQLARQFSGGNQQKILLGRSLAMNARLLIIDEPSRGVDVGARAEILSILQRAAGQQRAILVISSEFEELVELCTRVLVMYRGRLVREIAGVDMKEELILRAALGLTDEVPVEAQEELR
jgi:monosaccharide-transporting ATPase